MEENVNFDRRIFVITLNFSEDEFKFLMKQAKILGVYNPAYERLAVEEVVNFIVQTRINRSVQNGRV